MSTLPSWLGWALLSAMFAALTAIFAKLGVAGIPSDLATVIRTVVVVAVATVLVAATGEWRAVSEVTPRGWMFLVLSGLATGASWLAWFRALAVGEASRVAPVDKLSVVFVAVIAAIVFGEHLPPLGWLGIGLVALGSILVAIA